jgi:Na+/proline symporter
MSTPTPSSHYKILHLSTLDLIVCVIFFLITIYVGLTAAPKSKPATTATANKQKENNKDDYFTGGRKQSYLLVAVSLLSGLTSGISYLGCPGLAFETGAVQFFFQLGGILATPVITHLLIPFYHRSGVKTLYGFLHLRFGVTVRKVASFIFIIRTIMYLSIVLVAPSIVVKIFGVSQQWFIIVCGSMSTLYTAKGGLASVLSTDALQSVALTVVVLIVFTSCWINTSNVTIDTKLSDPKYWGVGLYSPPALTVFSGLIGGFTAVAAQAGADQIAVQRYLAVPTIKDAQKSAAIGVLTSAMFTGFQIFTGMLLYSYFQGISPVDSTDAILPFYVGSHMSNGAAGMCLAALTGCTMSVLSGGLNSVVTCCVFDLFGRKELKDDNDDEGDDDDGDDEDDKDEEKSSNDNNNGANNGMNNDTDNTAKVVGGNGTGNDAEMKGVVGVAGSDTVETKNKNNRLTSVWASKILTLIVGGVVTTTSWLLSFGTFQLVTLSNRVLGSMSGPCLGLFILAICVPSCERIGALSGLAVSFILALVSASVEDDSYFAISAFVVSPVLCTTTILVGWIVSGIAVTGKWSCIETETVRKRRCKGLTIYDVGVVGSHLGYERVVTDEDEDGQEDGTKTNKLPENTFGNIEDMATKSE